MQPPSSLRILAAQISLYVHERARGWMDPRIESGGFVCLYLLPLLEKGLAVCWLSAKYIFGIEFNMSMVRYCPNVCV